MATAEKASSRTEAFFRSLGIPAKLSEVGVRAEDFEAMAEHVEKFWYPLSGAFTLMDRAGVLVIFRAAASFFREKASSRCKNSRTYV